MSKNIKDIGLPKWPAFVVVGKDVTREQAMEVIIRTTSFYFSSNDREFEKELYDFLGVKKEEYDRPSWEDISKIETELKVVRVAGSEDFDEDAGKLQYLDNYRVLSAWVGGPHGWINWDGKVGCNNSNIGKWPSVEEVQAEWEAIAKAFPFLDLKCQLFSGESCEKGIVPVVQFDICNGKVKAFEPKTVLKEPVSDTNDSMADLFTPGRERGCTIARFAEAVGYVRGRNEN